MLSEEKTEICTTFRLDNDCCAQAEVFCVVTPCSVVVGYKCFKGPCCLHLQGEVLNMPSLYRMFQSTLFPLIKLYQRTCSILHPEVFFGKLVIIQFLE